MSKAAYTDTPYPASNQPKGAPEIPSFSGQEIDRRRLFRLGATAAGAALVASVPIVAAATTVAHPDQALLDLWAEIQRCERLWIARQGSAADDDEGDQNADREAAIGYQIAALPASTAEGMAVKLWCMAAYGAKWEARDELALSPKLMPQRHILSLIADAERLLPAPDIARYTEHA